MKLNFAFYYEPMGDVSKIVIFLQYSKVVSFYE